MGARLKQVAFATFVVGLFVLSAIWWRDRGVPVIAVAGLAVGLVAAVWPPGRAAADVVAALLRAVRPLGLPLLVIVIAGAGALPTAQQFMIGATAAYAAWRWIVKPEAAAAAAGGFVFALMMRTLFVAFSALVLPAAVLALILWKWAYPTLAWFDGRGGLAAALAFAAVLISAAALVLRLVAVSTSPVRVLVSCASLALTIRVAIWVGVLPGEGTLGQYVSVRVELMAGAIVLGFALIVEGLSAWRAAQSVPMAGGGNQTRAARIVGGAAAAVEWLVRARVLPGIVERANRLGMAAAVACSLVLAAGIAWGLRAAAERHAVLTGDYEEVRPELPRRGQRPIDIGDDLELARMYVPVLEFTESQRWAPIKVDSYLRSATLIRPQGGRARAPAVNELPTTCRITNAAPCYTLTIDCPAGEQPCAGGRKRAESEPYFSHGGAAYVRVVRRERKTPDSSPDAFSNKGPFASRVTHLLQYWFFYRYDEWSTPALAGRLTQRHEADWEAVTIGLSDTEPLFVAYSAHCGGRWSRWSDIQVENSEKPWIHPLIAVAEGSQANYDQPYGGRPPDWASCAGVEGETAAALSFATNIRDRTDDGWELVPRELILVDAGTPPMTFPGRWGANAETLLENFRSIKLSGGDHGPMTPTLQPLWRDPLGTIFCSANWRPRRCDQS